MNYVIVIERRHERVREYSHIKRHPTIGFKREREHIRQQAFNINATKTFLINLN